MQFFKIKENHGNVKQYVKVEKVERLYLFERISGLPAAFLILALSLLGVLIIYAAQTRTEQKPLKTEEPPSIVQEKIPEKAKYEILTGPRGGQFYINRNGNKRYLSSDKNKHKTNKNSQQ
ncbi:hypothetical protein HF882_08940 [Victivallis vadensis]|uniref:PBCV-specific basic adaptor protein n=1 Tax=Victivallis vadensis TaxID=172901 RepID=A0A848AXA4_9BACT|nr:hypothetical protein [Victivallis vadensis]NMD86707.1 hypothetical protein [Victivallis vadensis]